MEKKEKRLSFGPSWNGGQTHGDAQSCGREEGLGNGEGSLLSQNLNLGFEPEPHRKKQGQPLIAEAVGEASLV